jgi:hypothetical protein
MSRIIFGLCAAILLAGCSSKPGDDDIRAALVQNLPPTQKSAVVVDQVQPETSGSGDEVVIKFKSTLKATAPLFAPMDFDAAAREAGGDPALFAQVEGVAEALSPEGRARFTADIAEATQKPLLLKLVTPSGTASEWYGSFKAKKIVDKWLISDFHTEAAPKLQGEPRTVFVGTALDQEQAKKWFGDMKAKQQTLLGRLADAQALESKDAELAQQKAATEQERQARERERQAKEALMASEQHRARQLPFMYRMRPAALGASLVLEMQVMRPMTLKVDITRGLQRFSRDIQAAPGKVVAFGHLQGWGFKSGDQVTVSNPAFDAASFTVR